MNTRIDVPTLCIGEGRTSLHTNVAKNWNHEYSLDA